MRFQKNCFILMAGLTAVHGFCPAVRVKLSKSKASFASLSVSTQSTVTTSTSADNDDETQTYCLPLEHVGLDDLPRVGGKTASLGEMIQRLTPLGVDVPGGFAVTADAYDAVLDRCRLRERLTSLMEGLDVTNLDDLAERGTQARHMIIHAGLPEDVRHQIEEAYRSMAGDDRTDREMCNISVAVRSSATAEDLPTASFAGQQASFLNVVGAKAVADAVLECLASVFTDRAITYRVQNDFDHMKIKGAVVVQLMVRSDLASAGVAFTLDPDTGFRDAVVITGSYGLGESVVGGKVDPDEVQVFKPMIGTAEDPIIRRRIGRKQTRIIYTKGVSHSRTRTVETTKADQARPCFTDEDAKIIAKWCVDIEDYYSKFHGKQTPMDIEWAKDGKTGKLYIVQARPETVRSRQEQSSFRQTIVTDHGPTILRGTATGSDAASGQVRVIQDLKDISKMQRGDILVADMTDPDWVPAIRLASAVVTNRGGRTCHAAIVSRELGVPCLVGTKDATDVLKTGETYTVDCSQGNTGLVYTGAAKLDRVNINKDDLPETKTKIQLILGDPDAALAHSGLPVAGVGLVRQEFVVANHIGIHPNAVLFPEKVSKEDQAIIRERAKNDPSPEAFFIRKLSEGIGSLAAAFHPRPIIVRLGDFKSNEYNRLVGGAPFEPHEENPMLGIRGASRYLHPDFKEAFELECKAIAHVRDKMNLKNLQIMIPFCRTTDEAKGVLEILARHGMERGKDGLMVWVMCELPANVLAIDDFAELFDGFSIGSNDLTQLVLGVDRDSGDLAHLFNEENPAVKEAIAQAIEGAHRNGRLVGLCGQAPSDKPDFAAFLVEKGIDSISLTPDAVIRAINIVAEAEKKVSKQDMAELDKSVKAAIQSDTADIPNKGGTKNALA